ncbi:MAG: hypothetical protein JXR48_18905, partial [Candidatus Delongbacteria bacterium]|nr:hypothetical protein [Candidatus Delongbacteria bacterium]
MEFVNELGEVVFSFSQMYMFDAKGELSEDVSISVQQIKKDEYIITVNADEAWLKQASYPVTIDPSLSNATNTLTVEDTFVYEGTTTDYSNYQYIILSSASSTNLYRGLIQFLLPASLANKQITYSYLQLTKDIQTENRTLCVYLNDSSFTPSTVTYATAPEYDDQMLDYHITSDLGFVYRFDVTSAVQDMHQYEQSVYMGFTIIDKEEYGANNSVKSIEYGGTAQPIMEVGYVDSEGIKDYWTYTSSSSGNAGSGYVSDLTGYLVWARTDLSFNTEKQSLGLSMFYNSQQSSVDLGYGYGWQTNYNYVAGIDTQSLLPYIVDPTGSKLYFHPVTFETNPNFPSIVIGGYKEYYIAEDGSGKIMAIAFDSEGSITGYYVITGDDTYLRFEHEGVNYIWYLSTITTNYSTTTSLSLSIQRLTNYPAQIQRVIDSTGNYIDFAYINGRLDNTILYVKYSSTSYKNPQKVTYSYTTDASGDFIINLAYLIDIDVNGSFYSSKQSEYTLDANKKLVTAEELNGTFVEYSYLTNGKIDCVSSGYDNTYFSAISYDYEFRKTTITDQDGFFVTKKFDDYGHTINVVNSSGVSESYQYLNLFKEVSNEDEIYTYLDGTPNYFNNNKLIQKSDSQSTFVNPLVNPGFEYDLAATYDGWNFVQDVGSLSGAGRSSSIHHEGNYSMYVAEATGNKAHLEQTVSLEAGTYTLSGYVYNSASSSQVYIDVVGEYDGSGITLVPDSDEWTYVNLLFVVEDDDTDITVKLVNESSGTVYFDEIKISEGFSSAECNIVENSSFEYFDYLGTPGLQLTGWTLSDSDVSRFSLTYDDSIYEDVLGEYGIKILGDSSETKYAESILVNFSQQNSSGTLMIGGWGKSEGTATSVMPGDESTKYFRIRVETNDGTNIDSYYVYFDTSIRGWQYTYGNIPIESNVQSVSIFLEYRGEGTVYFDSVEINYESSFYSYSYDSQGRLLSLTKPDGSSVSYEYDAETPFSSVPALITQSNGQTVSIDPDNNIINSVTFNNVTATPTYNQYGQTTSIRYGSDTQYFTMSTQYLASGYSQYVESQTDEFGNETNYYTNILNGFLTAVENAKGQDIHYIYDNFGNLQKVISVDDYTNYNTSEIDGSVVYGYDSENRLTKIYLDYDNDATRYYEIVYDDEGRMETVLVDSNVLMSYTYDDGSTYASANVETQTYGNNDSIRFEYDEFNNVIGLYFAESYGGEYLKYSYEYDSLGRLNVYTYTNSLGVIIQKEYYKYDLSGRISEILDQDGNITKYGYDGEGNLALISFTADDITFDIQYESNKTLYFGVDNPYNTQSSLYDQTTININDSTIATKIYNYEQSAFYRLHSLQTFVGSTAIITENFNYSGNTTRISEIQYLITGSSTLKYVYEYDELGNITCLKVWSGTVLLEQNDYTYDNLNQVTKESIYHNDSTGSCLISNSNCFTNVYEYDSHGNIISKTTNVNQMLPEIFMKNNSSVAIETYYNGNLYSDFYSLSLGQTPTLSFSYVNPNDSTFYTGVTTTKLSSNLNVNTAGYYYSYYHAYKSGAGIDIYFRIYFKVGTVNNFAAINYTYDEEGWVDQLESYITYVGTTGTSHQITYDDQGNPTRITNFKYNGTNYSYASFAWDGRQLSDIYLVGTSGPIYRVSYLYNDQGIRISKTFYSWINYNWSLTKEVSYRILGDKIIEETDGTYDIIYLYDYNGSLIGFQYDTGTSINNYYYITDQQGNITKIVSSTGSIVATYQYDAYGNILKTTGTLASINPYTYRGYRMDYETNFYYLTSRYYVPQIGRFLNSDGLLGQEANILSHNMYAYCANNPV